MPFDHVRAWKQEFETAGWWHSFELPSGGVIEGQCSLAGLKERLAIFPIPADLTGKNVLDIGTWDGWFAFELAKRGAQVVAIDCIDNPRFHEMRQLLRLEDRVAHRLLDVYDLSPETAGRFDIVMFLGVLYHLKHPLWALEKVCSVTRNLACVDSFVLREEHRPESNLEHRLVMEFFETDEFGGQTDNWVAPNASCLAALCRTAGFARVELRGKLPYSAPFACHRQWIAPATEWGPLPLLTQVFHHLNFGRNFTGRNDEYVTAWFAHESAGLTLDDVQPEVAGYGVRPIHVSNKDAGWRVTFKLPPGLPRGWHDVRLRVKGGPLSPGVRIAVDLPVETRNLRIVSVADGTTWKDGEIDFTQGEILSLWVEGLPENADRGNLRVRIAGSPAKVVYIEPAGAGEYRQVNIVVPPGEDSEASVEVAIGAATARWRLRTKGSGH